MRVIAARMLGMIWGALQVRNSDLYIISIAPYSIQIISGQGWGAWVKSGFWHQNRICSSWLTDDWWFIHSICCDGFVPRDWLGFCCDDFVPRDWLGFCCDEFVPRDWLFGFCCDEFVLRDWLWFCCEGCVLREWLTHSSGFAVTKKPEFVMLKVVC